MSKKIQLAVIGAGGLGREVAWLIEDINRDSERFEFIGFIDDVNKGTIEGHPVAGTLQDWLDRGSRSVLVCCALGDPFDRYQVVERFAKAGFSFATLIHPSVQYSRFVEIGVGSIICAGTILTTNIKVGKHVVISPGCTVGHDSELRDFCSLMPGVHVAGHVILGEGVYLGIGAVVINRVRVGQWTVVGAGAAVVSDVPPSVVAVGVPARAIKQNDRVPQ